ncbi:MAG: sigma-54-dependent Fis family transcriptional regulator [Gammaproteobacteria bacterium]|nr:sigma-54-dependent Fis family transcriptional regulator [Gammaproteobacteria bacterium]
MSERPKLCLVEDDPIMGESLTHRFSLEGVPCDWHQDARSALTAFEKTDYAALVSDIRLPDQSAESMFQSLLERGKAPPPTLFITGFGSIDQAVRLLKQGAHDYIAKPFDLDELLTRLRTLCPELFGGPETSCRDPFLGVSRVMQGIQDMLARIAEHSTSVLITGESGVGKEYAARYLYQCRDPSQTLPFVAINCAALPENLLEAELFGFERGAFTGADHRHRGVFERAHSGTLLLDEIGEMSTAMQVKLLRAIQEGTVQRIGSEETIKVDICLIFTTNRDLKKAVRAGEFREDLYFRINVIHIEIPPLRERKNDIVWFSRRFVVDYSREHNVRRYLQPVSEHYLTSQSWPGNLRELWHTIERACVLAPQEMLGPKELGMVGAEENVKNQSGEKDLKAYLRDCESHHIEENLEQHGWRIAETAASLGISRKNLWEKMRKYNLRVKN